jgi:hypothetical protein
MFHDYTPDRAEEQANLRLAAAAPELLTALTALLKSIENYDRTHPFPGDRIPWAQAEAAIAKATQEVKG